MRQFIDVTGKTEDEAISRALEQLKLDENDRSTTTRLMKVKDMLLKEAIEEKRAADAAALETFSGGEAQKA